MGRCFSPSWGGPLERTCGAISSSSSDPRTRAARGWVPCPWGSPMTTRRSPWIARVGPTGGGRSFPPPTRLLVSSLSLNTQNPVVLSDGTLVVSLEDYARQTDKGQAWVERERSWILTSTDGGKTFSVPMLASEGCQKSFGTLAVDPSSGPFRDRLYWICTSDRYESVLLHF